MPSSDERFHPLSPEPKQAVVLIHGMGEQEPMGTIRDFVKAVWVTDETVRPPSLSPPPHDIWIKPDIKTGLQDLKRITTKPYKDRETGATGYRTDFFELYWADLNKGSTLAEVENWIFGLLCRNPFKSVPPPLFFAWLLLLFVTLAVAYFAAIAIFKPESAVPYTHFYPFGWVKGSPFGPWFGPLIGVLLAAGMQRWLLPYIGCVVKYTRARPENIAARKTIWERGHGLLEALHDGTYERIVIVSHSLGTILALDLLSLFWASHPGSHSFEMNGEEMKLLIEIENAAKALREEDKMPVQKSGFIAWLKAALSAPINPTIKRSPDILQRTPAQQAFDEAQRKLACVLRQRSLPPAAPDQCRRWLITDFITLGSPLTHSEFLLHSNKNEFADHKRERDIAASPPVEDKITDPDQCRKAQNSGFSYVMDNDNGLRAEPPYIGMSFPFTISHTKDNVEDFWQLHHAAPFAVVRWTNIYAPHHLFYLRGDMISGPLAPLFGSGVHDICLDDYQKSRFFAHTKYWQLDKNGKATEAVKKLREALNLGCKGGV
jgi:hypothetical protein